MKTYFQETKLYFLRASTTIPLDLEPPILVNDNFSLLTNNSHFMLQGSFTDGPNNSASGIKSIEVFVNNISQGFASPIPGQGAITGSFNMNLNLTEGDNIILEVAKDNIGNTAQFTKNIFLDSVAPVVNKTVPINNTRVVDENLVENGVQVSVQGTASDNAPSLGLTNIVVNNINLSLLNGSFSGITTLPTGGLHTITATARDNVGNLGKDIEIVCASDINTQLISLSEDLAIRHRFKVLGSGNITIKLPEEFFDDDIYETYPAITLSNGTSVNAIVTQLNDEIILSFTKLSLDVTDYLILLKGDDENVKLVIKLEEKIAEEQTKTTPNNEKIAELQTELEKAKASISFSLDNLNNICDVLMKTDSAIYNEFEVAFEKDKFEKETKTIRVQHKDVNTITIGGTEFQAGQPASLRIKVTSIPKDGSASITVQHYTNDPNKTSCILPLDVVSHEEIEEDDSRTSVYREFFTYTSTCSNTDDLITKTITIKDSLGNILVTHQEQMPIAVNNIDGFWCNTFGWFC